MGLPINGQGKNQSDLREVLSSFHRLQVEDKLTEYLAFKQTKSGLG